MSNNLFRGFHKDENCNQKIFVNGEWITGRWVEGYLVVSDERYFIGHHPECLTELYYPDDIYSFTSFVEVIPETVGQYTGLQDATHQKIFEYDFILFGLIPCVVRYDVENARFMLYEDNKYLKNGFNSDTMEFYTVQGTVFDHPEFVEV